MSTTGHLRGDLPPALRDWMEQWRALLGIGDWELDVRLVNQPGAQPTTTGLTQLLPAYLRATIRLMSDLPPERARATAAHELLHVALGELYQTVVRITEWLPEADQRRALDLYSDAEDRTIERLRRALQAILEDSDHGKDFDH